MDEKKCVLSLDEIELIKEYLEILAATRSQGATIHYMILRRYNTGKLNLDTPQQHQAAIVSLEQQITEILARATKAYIDSRKEEIELLKKRT
jgi:hypothetical protein